MGKGGWSGGFHGEKPGDRRRGGGGNGMFTEGVGKGANRNKDGRKRANIFAQGRFSHRVFTTLIATTKKPSI